MGKLEVPKYYDPLLEILLERGLQHEERYINDLIGNGLSITKIEDENDKGFQQTIQAIKSGDDAIVQAILHEGRWGGRADVLIKKEKPSDLGSWSYEVVDTKLSLETKGGTLLQLSLYSEILGNLQNDIPEYMHVITPQQKESYRTHDFLAYFRLAKKNLENFMDEDAKDARDAIYPEPILHCEICRWWSVCNNKRRSDDHLGFVAGLSKLHRKEFEENGITTLASLANAKIPFSWIPERGNIKVYEKAREQARLQFEERNSGSPIYEILPIELGYGLCRLPPPSDGDIFFDIEGDIFVGDGGLEYLFGYVIVDESSPAYRGTWALETGTERQMFEQFMDILIERLKSFPDLHIYHYAPYEPSALKRLMGRHATREDELDILLRDERFVDLHDVVKQSILASVERYSIKELEKLACPLRTVPAIKLVFNLNWAHKEASHAKKTLQT